MAALQARLAECRLEMHPTKTKIVYCKDGKPQGKYPNIKFDFLGYCFRPRLVKNSGTRQLFCSFTPAVSPSALKSMRAKIRELGIRHRTDCRWRTSPRISIRSFGAGLLTMGDTAPSALYPLLRHVNQTLLAWAMRKFKRFRGHKTRASHSSKIVRGKTRDLFVHWRLGMIGVFA